MIKNISNLGDAALYCDFGNSINKEINSKVIRYFQSIRNQKIQASINLTPSYNKLIISLDLTKTNSNKIKKISENISLDPLENLSSKKSEIPVCCNEKFSLDLERLEKKLNLNRNKMLDIYFNKEYFCYMTGYIE